MQNRPDDDEARTDRPQPDDRPQPGDQARPDDHARPGAASRSGRPRRRSRAVAAAAAAAAAVLGAGAVTAGVVGTGAVTTVASGTAQAARHVALPPGAGDDGSGTGGPTRAATAQEEVGVVDIDTVLDYGTGRAAGTGLVLTADGEVLTNNHVVADATSITVTVVGTGASYRASVVGTDATDDVAVLRLADASGLTPAVLASSAQQAAVAPGTAVTAVGNAGGVGGTPSAAPGTVLALDQAITAGDESGGDSEQLTGMIEVDAAIEAGDSGGPLYAGGAVVGIDTAASSASSGPSFRTAALPGSSSGTVGFAIPIGTALDIAQQITSGEQSDAITQGTPAFLGVELAQGAGGVADPAAEGAVVSGVVPGGPAAAAGLAAGDVVTSVGATPVDGPDALSAALAAHRPGDHVEIGWSDASGSARTATVTLAAGPAA
ncbi:hypothetical protein GCM10023403_03420 [Pseudonocardia benzenivorans]|uniref:PDZ/DHR/GLGF domain protein n=1 Tax=Pseudonocardia dioxanivorans (strain ATCC 55486 / DSM 44775 / JCM 13855 / CB1190) TaxID=675635 RepID=F4CX17_PSEUX|nr:trypsin-like peptidase domain-containing protein [Pseudonocardia dioxanivorans]AEA24648.1 PDZ/DHR/GLGF domain protein [Pseudonocardia dioxanivorans CB1190]